MPPFLPRKRLFSTPPASPHPQSARKVRLADVLDAESRNIPGLDRKKVFSVGSDDSDSSLSEVDSDEFEDVPAAANLRPSSQPNKEEEEDDEDEDEDIEWEDAAGNNIAPESSTTHTPLADGPIELVFRKDDNEIDYGTAAAADKGKKGPSKREKEARVRTHKMHVQFLLWHNAIRNKWICDKTVQKTLVDQLPPQIRKEVDKWRKASGLVEPHKEVRSKEDQNRKRKRPIDPRKERDWGRPSQRLEKGKADMSNGDPLISLMKVLSAYWKKRFAITAPGLRKRGYGTKQALKQAIYSFRNDEHDPEEHGERIRNLDEFREAARKCEGSRDVGAQLFTALLRGIGIESRMVASLQPSGFGWTKAEQSVARKPANPLEEDTSSDESDLDDSRSISEITKSRNGKSKVQLRKEGKQPVRNSKLSGVIDLDSESTADNDEKGDDDSVLDITPSMPKRRPQKYDRDNPFPIYWTEAISPITNKVLPISPLVLASPVASTPEILATFEPRGAKAEKTKTVMAYVVGYSSDGTAKDVTVRYLKKRIWPGKTKGFRYPVEKIPVYNKHGKVKRYEDFDWFKRVMSSYVRPDSKRTAVDDVEEAYNLVPQLPEKKEFNTDIDTLQSLKASADFVLERFLRREEALRPGAKPDRMFASGKGENLKQEPVYRRSDVERCLTAESWHKEGRRPKTGEAPLKLVPIRAVTLTRKREAEEHERITGQRQMQGLYSWDQTEYIIPPPIENGIIPKNAYGNIDCFVPSMVPNGAVHIPLRGTVRICKKLDIDYAEAVTGFEFGNKRAVPVCTGVVVAKENEKAVIQAWKKFNEEQKKKEEGKMEKLVLDLWRKFVMGLRIRERVQDTYGDVVADLGDGTSKDQPISLDDDEDMPGAALPLAEDDYAFGGGGFIVDDEEPAVPEDLEMVHHEEPPNMKMAKGKGKDQEDAAYPTPTSIPPLKAPVRRQRASLLRVSQTRDNVSASDGMSDDDDGSELSSMSSQSGDEGADDQPEGMSSDSGNEGSATSPKSKTLIEVSIPGPRLRRSRKVVVESEDEDDLSDGSESILSSAPEPEDGEDDEDEYKPAKKTPSSSAAATVRARKRGAQVEEESMSTDLRKTRSGANPRGRPPTAKRKEGGLGASTTATTRGILNDEEEEPDTPQPKRTRRQLRRDSTLVTSPYFTG
ncbi:DNA repair protein rhp42 [Exophiala dermatitidis]